MNSETKGIIFMSFGMLFIIVGLIVIQIGWATDPFSYSEEKTQFEVLMEEYFGYSLGAGLLVLIFAIIYNVDPVLFPLFAWGCLGLWGIGFLTAGIGSAIDL